MTRYLDSFLQDFPEHLGLAESTPATDHLVKVFDEIKK